MRYSIEPRDLLSFAKNMGKNLSNKYGQKLLDSVKKYQKEQFKKQQRQLMIWLVIKLLIK